MQFNEEQHNSTTRDKLTLYITRLDGDKVKWGRMVKEEVKSSKTGNDLTWSYMSVDVKWWWRTEPSNIDIQ